MTFEQAILKLNRLFNAKAFDELYMAIIGEINLYRDENEDLKQQLKFLETKLEAKV